MNSSPSISYGPFSRTIRETSINIFLIQSQEKISCQHQRQGPNNPEQVKIQNTKDMERENHNLLYIETSRNVAYITHDKHY
ncbi:hypothetical protein CEXT_714301 [Caerostris extrusa]|uniref:Uncharacterized protein n=1 Tax=Caerostris extrusa TaxID=172846 RepID=A0AAV4VUS4_CAEEX|nr:hypothetical protein CEXT_714301 [Caerostris extrusa]